jgi:hypothetical protein
MSIFSDFSVLCAEVIFVADYSSSLYTVHFFNPFLMFLLTLLVFSVEARADWALWLDGRVIYTTFLRLLSPSSRGEMRRTTRGAGDRGGPHRPGVC